MVKLGGVQKFVILIFFLSLVTRLAVAPFYVSSELPIDFPHYIDAGRTVLEGKILYVDYQHPWGPLNKGPLFALVMAAWIGLFGEDYVLLKIPAILFDSLTVVLVFYITREIVSLKAAKYASILYSFSYVALLSSAVTGNNDNYYLFFIMLSVYLLVKKEPSFRSSAVILGVATGFGYVSLALMLPLFLYYIYRRGDAKMIPSYCLIFTATFLIIILPFVVRAGWYAFSKNYFYIPSIFGTSLQALIRYISGYFIYGPYNSPADYIPVIRGENALIEQISIPIVALGYGLAIFYILRYRLQDKKAELIRNISIFILVTFIFGRMMDATYFILILPFAITIYFFFISKYDEFRLSGTVIAGIVLVTLSIVIHSYIYRWEKLPRYSDLELVLMLFGIAMAAAGTYLTMEKFYLGKTWSFAILAVAIVRHQHARFLYLLGPIIPMFQDRMWTWGYFYIFSIVIFLIAMVVLFFGLHRIQSFIKLGDAHV